MKSSTAPTEKPATVSRPNGAARIELLHAEFGGDNWIILHFEAIKSRWAVSVALEDIHDFRKFRVAVLRTHKLWVFHDSEQQGETDLDREDAWCDAVAAAIRHGAKR